MNNDRKVWLITGADKGLGAATAEAALRRGDRVIVTALAADGEHPLSQQCPERFRAFHLDARDSDRIPAVMASAEAAFGRIDVVVNNAGYGLLAAAEETTAEYYRPLFEVHFFSMVEVNRCLLPGMRQRRRGHIINLSSVAGFGVTKGFTLYGAAKFAVEGYSEGLASEVNPLGIHVTILEPGGFRSDFAGSSLRIIPTENPDYRALSHYIASYSASRHGSQPNNPDLFGPTVWEIAQLEQPPLRLPLGRDAAAFVREQSLQVLAECERWHELSARTTDR